MNCPDDGRVERLCGGLSRRGFLHASPLVGLKAMAAVDGPRSGASCIVLMLTGGPSQLDTWDMKPGAPAEIRGPYRPIKTNVPGIEISEIFPRMARQADKFALVRSVHHTAPATHETGLELMRMGLPAHGVAAERAASEVDVQREPERVRERYGNNTFGKSCLRARRSIEAGERFVTVNMFDTVFGELTWDIHGAEPFSPMSCYRDHVGPMFDMAYSALLQDLDERGLLTTTMVWCLSEFGRTPRINALGGRDHWPHCWTVLAAGGPIRGGNVVGSSDNTGSAPKDRPVTPAEVAATIRHGMGIGLDTAPPGADARPICELLS